MKRRLRHSLIWIVLALAGSLLASRWLKSTNQSDVAVGDTSTARAREAVILDREEWVAFRIPSTALGFKVLSRANLVGEVPSLVDQEFPYEVEYQLRSLGGQIVGRGTFALTGRVIPMVDAEGTFQLQAFFRDQTFTLARARVSTLELEAEEVLILRLRAPAFDVPVAGVTARVLLRHRIPARRVGYLWSRLSAADRARIIQPRVHALIDLTPEEKRGVLQNRWKPLGAQGVAQRDYRARTLYLRDDLVPARRQLIEPLGVGELRCGANLRAIIGIPRPGGEIRLRFRRVNSDAPAEVQIRFFGETINQRSIHAHRIGTATSEFSGRFSPGMLEIESPTDVTILPFWTADGSEDDEQLLEFEPAVSRTWRVGSGEPVTFPLGGDRSAGSLFRVNARPGSAAPSGLRFEFLDVSGAVVHAGSHEIAAVPSLYDVLLTPAGEAAANDPATVIFDVPRGVAAIRFHADANVLVNGYTRPLALTHCTRVPEDYTRAIPDPERLPVWYTVLPEHGDDLIRAHRSSLVRSQPRPPEDDADIIAGKFQWEDFQPIEGALGQYLLHARDPNSPSRDAALPSLFMPLAVGVDQPLALAHPAGLERPSRRLAFVRAGRDPTPLKISVDGSAFFERDLVTERGEFLVPPLPPGAQTMRIESPALGLRCFLNYVRPERATMLKRLAQRISPGRPLTFLCEKATGDDELLTGMWFAPGDSAEKAEIHVAIRPGADGAFLPEAETFTPRDRIYLITPQQGTQTSPVLGGKIAAVRGGQRFFIPLGRDLAAGKYELRIALRGGVESYLTLSKVTGGDYSDARFFREVSR